MAPTYEYKEQWRPVVGYEGHYEVSDQGRVKRLAYARTDTRGRTSKRAEKLLQCNSKANNYPTATLHISSNYTRHRVHQLVLSAFIGPCPDGMECCHNNGIRSDSRLENLRYDTRAGNMADCVLHGTTNRGERSGLAVLTEKDVLQIRKLRATGRHPVAALAERFGVSPMTISDVTNFRSWQHIEGSVKTKSVDCRLKLTAEDVHAIRVLATTGITQRQIAHKFNVDQSTVCRIINHVKRTRHQTT